MLKKLLINGKDVTFNCKAKRTKTGFAHECELLINGVYFTDVKVNYYNRTWEAYPFQTAMKNAVHDLLDELYKETEMILKEEEGWKRITKDRRDTIDCIYNDSATKQFYDEIMRAL